MSLSKYSLDYDLLEEQAIESLIFENIEDFEDKPIPKKKRWPGLQIKTFAPVWTAAVKI